MILASLLELPLAANDEVAVWEYSPYRVKLWYAFEPSVTHAHASQALFLQQVESDLSRAFKATWELEVSPLPEHLQRDVQYSLDELTVTNMARNELVLCLSTTHPETKNLRTFRAAADSLTSIAASEQTRRALNRAARETKLDPQSIPGQILTKFSESDSSTTPPDLAVQSDAEIVQSLVEGKVSAAFLPRALASGVEGVRTLSTPFPWQSEGLLSEYDKLVVLLVGLDGDNYRVRAREIDCPMQFVGAICTTRASSWSEAATQASAAVQSAFSPIARVEAAESKNAVLRHRAGGLIVPEDESHPARIRVGDVMQAIVRRDDRSGKPILVQPLDFTYAAITGSDGVTMQANVYTYSGGPGLRGRQNSRTRRVLLRARPSETHTDLRVVVRGDRQRVQAGCGVYVKDHLTDEFSFLGTTDWRGRIRVPVPQGTVEVVSSALKEQHAADRRAAYEAELAKASQAYDDEARRAQAEGREVPEFVPPALGRDEFTFDASSVIKLATPLVMLYVKSGSTVVARVPLVPGLNELETAELPDDSLRLQAEAHVRGFQGRVLDLIGLRNLLAARVRLNAKKGNLDSARRALDQLRGLADFNKMNDELNRIQQTILQQADPNIPQSTQTQIDRMFKVTRDMLQTYLQTETVAEASRLLEEASESQPSGAGQ